MEWEKIKIPNTNNYFLVRNSKRKSGFSVWSEKSQKFLKDTTSWGRKDQGDNETFGISFIGTHGESVQNKVTMRYLKRVCGIECI